MLQTVNHPLVSIVTVNYNQSIITLDMLASLRRISYSNIEIIVVDNASPNDSPDELKEQYPEIKLIKSEVNLGFAGGNNLGLQVATGAYIFFINNDTLVPENCLEPLVATLQQHPEVGMVSPKIKFFEAGNPVQYAGFTKLNPWTMRNRCIGYAQPDDGSFDTPGYTSAMHGAAMMISRTTLEKVGNMAECYFLYYEELDWAARIQRAGYKLYYQPKSYILHKESVSTGENSPLKTHYLARNRMLYIRRNITGIHYWVGMVYQLTIAMPKNLIQYLRYGQFSHIKAYLSGVAWNFNHKS